MSSILVTGDDLVIPQTLRKNGNTFSISDTAVVKSAIVSKDHCKIYADAVTMNKDATGADWANSLIILEFPSATTVNVDYQGPAIVETQVDDGGLKLTWFSPVHLVKGNIE
jgi:hypothetical protein